MTEDERFLSERVAQLEEEKKTWDKDRKRLAAEVSAERGKRLFEDIVTFGFMAVVAGGLIAAGGYGLFKSLMASTEKTSYCYISGTQNYSTKKPEFYLMGVVEWNQDRQYGYFFTFDEAVEKAKLIGCELR